MLRTFTLLCLAAVPAVADDNGKFEKFTLSPRLGVLTVSPAPDGKQLAIAVGDFTVRTWDLVKGEELQQWKAHEHPAIHRVAFAPDGKSIFSCCEDGAIKQWDAATGKELREFKAHSVGVKSVTISPNGKQLLSAGSDATLRLFEVDTGKLLHTLRINDGIVESPFASVAFTANGERALAGNAKGHVSLWDLKNGKQVNLFSGQKGAASAVAFSADGKEFFAADNDDGLIRHWSIAQGKVLNTLDGHAGGACSLDVSPDGTRLVSGGADKIIRVWDLKSGKEIHKLAEHEKRLTQVAFIGDQRVASTSEDGALIVWTLPKK
jgi:WD40 repeat protein